MSSSLPALLNSQPPKPFSLFPIYTNSLSSPHFLSLKPSPIHLSLRYDAVSAVHDGAEEEEDEHVIGDCLVFEEGVFEDPYLNDPPPAPYSPTRKGKLVISVEPEDLVPEKWKEAQAEINVTKKERRRMKVAAEFGTKFARKRQGLIPAGMSADEFRTVKLAELKPVVLDRPNFVVEETVEKEKDMDSGSGGDGDGSGVVQGSGRAEPRNPRLAVYGAGLDDVLEFLNSERYDPEAAKKPEGSRNKLFTKEEKDLMNKRVPDLAAVTSCKWQPLHTVAAAGEFYLVDTLLKHNVDINVPDKDGLTALHKAVLGKKQAIFNYLLRESANPFIRDKEGATLMHYAVRTASSPMIKILLLYNVDINLQDNNGWTPLHLAVQSRRTDIVRLLLIKGADKALKNQDGLTPFDFCLYSGRDTRTYELIKLMKQLPKPRGHVLQQNQLTS